MSNIMDWQKRLGLILHPLAKGYARLIQLYGVHKAMREVRKKGYLASRKTLSNGAIKLTIGGV